MTDLGKDHEHTTTRVKIVEVHKCPLGIIINPFWIRVLLGCITLCGSLVGWGIAQGYSFGSSMSTTLQQHSIMLNQLDKADLPNRIVRIEVTQQINQEAQNRMETKLDRLFEVWHQPNPAPRPKYIVTAPVAGVPELNSTGNN